MLNPQLVYPFLRRGSVWLFFHVQFPDGEPKAKYCVAMEDYHESLSEVVVVLTTSDLTFADKPWTVVVSARTVDGLHGDSLVDTQNYKLVPVQRFLDSSMCKRTGSLPENVMRSIDEALVHAAKVPTHVILRMRPRRS